MDIVSNHADLLYGVHTTIRAVSTRSTLPILHNILIEASGETLTLTATDLEIWIRCVIPSQVKVPGSLAIPAQIFNDVMNSLPEADVCLTAEDHRLLLKCDTSDYTILSLPAEEYPSLPEVGEETSFEVPGGILKNLLRTTTFAASKEETRAILTGALMEIEGKKFSVVATDTHRLALRTSHLPQAVEQSTSVIVPARALNELQRVLPDGGEIPVKVNLAANQIQFSVDRSSGSVASLTIVSRVIDGQFPNYSKVIPKDHDRRIVVNLKELLDVLKRVAIVAKENANKAVFQAAGNRLIIQAESQEVGRGYEEADIRMEGDEIEIAFSVQYLIEVLSVLESEEVAIELTGPLNPGVILPETKSGRSGEDEYIYVLMPMQK